MFSEEVNRRNIPPLLPCGIIPGGWETVRDKLVALFAENVYGVSPAAPKAVTSEVQKEDKTAFAGKATHRHVLISFDAPEGVFSFGIDTVVPNGRDKLSMFIFLSFHTYYESYETPIEEILDNGYALAILHYEAVTADNDDMTSKLAGLLPRAGGKNEWGKIGVWAYALSRVMDYVQTLDCINKERIDCGAFKARQNGIVVLRAGYAL